ncbi:MAG: hypothetical protein NUV80_00840 [Candidatus Berkelbacteria bacterium]|nr:hypothetical protein [Candidatus Berkelbacteria bacterium]
MTTTRQRVYGMEYEVEYMPDMGIERWRLFPHHPFQLPDGRLRIGINEKIIRMAEAQNVQRFVIGDGDNEMLLPVPNKRVLKQMEKAGAYQEMPSIFEGREGFKIYFFQVG